MTRKMDYSKIRRKPREFDDQKIKDAFSSTSVVLIYTDGSCLKNPGGAGGWAAILKIGRETKELFGCMASTTNNIAELTGPIMALEYLSKPSSVMIFSDSQYVVKGASAWIKGWKKRGWKTADGDPVKNRELWVRLDVAAQRHRITWHWVRGHNGHPENERCDFLAGEAARKQIAA